MQSLGPASDLHRISVVIPVYKGELTLPALVKELSSLAVPTKTPDGNSFVIEETLLTYDNGPDGSASVIRRLDEDYAFVRPIWLSKNFGQHAATLAGIASSGSEWVVTLDEDGQHDPADIGSLLDAALLHQTAVTYGKPTNPPPHGALRNAASKGAKVIAARVLSAKGAPDYQSFRLILGSVARSLAAYAGSGAYLDVVLGWIAGPAGTAPITLRQEARASGYSRKGLASHFWRMVISSGTRGLRVVSVIGAALGILGSILAVVAIVERLTGGIDVPGWTSTIVVILVSSGATLISLGIIAEYIGVNVNMALGKPTYVIVSDPADGPLGRARQT